MRSQWPLPSDEELKNYINFQPDRPTWFFVKGCFIENGSAVELCVIQVVFACEAVSVLPLYF